MITIGTIMNTAWIMLIVAGIAEIGWPVGLKISQMPGRMIPGIVIALISLTISGGFLWYAQKEIPIGTSYAVWTGIGAAGTFLVGVWFFGDASSFLRFLAVSLIVAGVILLKYAH
jgi:quaternary ammonium compound-resistance protein SugE